MKTITLVLTIEETNVVLRALGELPYRDVHEVVANVRAQAERQAYGDADGPGPGTEPPPGPGTGP